ncbi:LrgB-like family-domain-containing protein [Mycotypha africana]|uniref:LrgB-like family-domain-containing protein n=1 Tax=Mycotypha africana TaxID=64632 RepID=UPI00230145B8|nr:LrgB-like family-domain-containing protein [Mycotypha africana]KAI8971917.1 LrgB-like family-domain-containing protein [Mycotypha africana]
MHKFPSNVAGMIVLFVLLMLSHAIFPHATDQCVARIDPYSAFALRSMNIMFVPAVVQIVLNPPTTGPEVGRMICVFVVGYIVSFVLCTVIVRLFRYVFLSSPLFSSKAVDTEKEKSRSHGKKNMSEEEIEIGVSSEPGSFSYIPTHISIPMSVRRFSDDGGSTTSTLTNVSTNASTYHHPLYTPSAIREQCSCGGGYGHDATTTTAATALGTDKEKKHGPLHSLAMWFMQQSTFDDLALLIGFALCAFVFLPLPESHPAMPFFRLFLYLTMTILLYSAACRMPARIRMIVHPIIFTATCVMAGIAYFERVKGFDIKHGVRLYKSGITFIGLVEKTHVGWPGGGDVLGAAMDVSIISLAFNVYKSRPESLREWLVIFCSIIPMAFFIMFVTPLFAHGIGCLPDDSLAWSSRSVTTAIGMVVGKVLGANESVVVCIIVFTGVCGPILGSSLFKLARVKDDDYMTIGITMGSSSHGVGTAYLIGKFPKASGMASLAFAIFGTIGVIVASIPVLSETIRRLSGY